jgi:hypothetical protein
MLDTSSSCKCSMHCANTRHSPTLGGYTQEYMMKRIVWYKAKGLEGFA